MSLELYNIRAAAQAKRIKWRHHALLRAYERRIRREQALQVIREGEIIEQHPGATPHPKCLMMAMIEPGRPLYVSPGYDRKRDVIHVITVHWLDPRKWDDPWTRKPDPPKLKGEETP